MAEFSAVWASIEAGVPILLLHMGVTMLLWLGSWRLSLLLVPASDEAPSDIVNHAVSLTRGGEALAFAIPLAACMTASVNTADILLWGLVAVLLQGGFSVLSLWLLPGLRSHLREGRIDSALCAVMVRTGFALINGAALAG